MTSLLYDDLSSCFVFKLLVEGLDVVVLKALDRSQNLNTPRLLLIVDILNDQSQVSFNVVIGTDVFVYLHHLAPTLSYIHAALLDNVRIEFVRLPLKKGLSCPFED